MSADDWRNLRNWKLLNASRKYRGAQDEMVTITRGELNLLLDAILETNDRIDRKEDHEREKDVTI